MRAGPRPRPEDSPLYFALTQPIATRGLAHPTAQAGNEGGLRGRERIEMEVLKAFYLARSHGGGGGYQGCFWCYKNTRKQGSDPERAA